MDGVIYTKSYDFAVRIVKLYRLLSTERKEYVLSKQILRSGTSIGALVSEAKHAQSKADFISKMNIALKEANETVYWLNLLKDTEIITVKEFDSIINEAVELVKILASIVKTSKSAK